MTMYTDKSNILCLAALLRDHGIRDVVLCPGSRNAPIVHTLAGMGCFRCHAVTDERSAGFFAIGLALEGGRPAAVCCTSGSALLNLHPAVAEAFYQQVPLVVVSADRPAAWIGQMDGQTLPQGGVFGSLARMSVSLPEGGTPEAAWHCNRLVNEAMLEATHRGMGPVHINVPVSGPLHGLAATEVPPARRITRHGTRSLAPQEAEELAGLMGVYAKRMVVVGQMPPERGFALTGTGTVPEAFLWVAEHLANHAHPCAGGRGTVITNADEVVLRMGDGVREAGMAPELLITYGGHVVSGRLKRFLRDHPPKEHWHVAADGRVADTFRCLTRVIDIDPLGFWRDVGPYVHCAPGTYAGEWEALARAVPEPTLPYSQASAIGDLMRSIPRGSVLHLANSSTVRCAQIFPLDRSVEVRCNRGVNGIEGSLSTAMGYASVSERLNFVAIGDLSFFCDMDSLWNGSLKANVRILLVNNSGGGIFGTLPGFDGAGGAGRFIAAEHATSARGWALERGFTYMGATGQRELDGAMRVLADPGAHDSPMLLEVFTDRDFDARAINEYHGF